MRPEAAPTAPALAASVVLAGVLLAGCGSAPVPSPPSGVDGLTIPTPSPDPADFVATIDNPWLPLAPGNEWVYREETDEGFETITVTVLEETREVAGVTATVVRDVVTDESGAVVEDTHDWFAQDAAGNVWYLGEDTVAYDDGRPDPEGSWEAGVDGAQAGVVMLARPRVGDGYRQEYAPGEAEDVGMVLALDQTVTGPAGSWDAVLLTRDTTPLEPAVVEQKYYAPGVGLVREESGGDVVELLRFRVG